MSDTKPPSDYPSYLNLEKLLSLQQPYSKDVGAEAHDEMLFIIVHQAYELWFKQIIHELDSLLHMFSNDFVDEKNLGVAVARMHRIIEIQKLLLAQIKVIETLTPLDFLDFRHYFGTASGFQSVQFRMVEIKLGLKPEQRISYSSKPYHEHVAKPSQTILKTMEAQTSLFEAVEKWLERTPFLHWKHFNFLEEYGRSVRKMLSADRSLLMNAANLSPEELKIREDSLATVEKNFETLLDEKKYQEQVSKGLKRLSHKATLGALFINLYRDQPILQLPYSFLESIIEVDELFTLWRYQHALMVLRMLGRKVGSGGSSGFDYLRSTVERHRVFGDLYNLATFLIPRSDIPKLPKEAEELLAFHYSLSSASQR